MMVAMAKLHTYGEKGLLEALLQILFELPWRQIVAFGGWEERPRNQAKNTFLGGILCICHHSFLLGLLVEVRKIFKVDSEVILFL